MTDCCGNCKHWDQDFVQNGWRLTMRSTRAAGTDKPWERDRDLENTYGYCQAVQMHVSSEQVEPPGPLAVVVDGSDYKADLFTRAEFGCALFTAATETETPE